MQKLQRDYIAIELSFGKSLSENLFDEQAGKRVGYMFNDDCIIWMEEQLGNGARFYVVLDPILGNQHIKGMRNHETVFKIITDPKNDLLCRDARRLLKIAHKKSKMVLFSKQHDAQPLEQALYIPTAAEIKTYGREFFYAIPFERYFCTSNSVHACTTSAAPALTFRVR